MTIAATQAATAAPATAAAAAVGIGSDFNTFLRMLTTQLRNQDPTNAMDTNQMTQQLVAFAQVEQQITMNSHLENLIGLQQTAQLTASAPLIGKPVEVQASQLALQGGTARLLLPAAGAASQVQITVQDGSGGTVLRTTVPLGASPGSWRWDGRDATGRRLADGAYNFQAQGLDPAGGSVPVSPTVLGTVTAATLQNGQARLLLGGLAVGFDQIRSLNPALP